MAAVSLTIRRMENNLRIDPSLADDELRNRIEATIEQLEKTFAEGFYSKITVHRHWSHHNPEISGKIARPSAYRWYLRRELFKLARRGAEITVARSRKRVDLSSPTLLSLIDETDFACIGPTTIGPRRLLPRGRRRKAAPTTSTLWSTTAKTTTTRDQLGR